MLDLRIRLLEKVFFIDLILIVVCGWNKFSKGFSMKNIYFKEDKSFILSSEVLESEETISFQTEIPKQIQQAMKVYIERHPNWNQYRLFQAALAGFLIQNGISSRLITRIYIGNMFGAHYF